MRSSSPGYRVPGKIFVASGLRLAASPSFEGASRAQIPGAMKSAERPSSTSGLSPTTMHVTDATSPRLRSRSCRPIRVSCRLIGATPPVRCALAVSTVRPQSRRLLLESLVEERLHFLLDRLHRLTRKCGRTDQPCASIFSGGRRRRPDHRAPSAAEPALFLVVLVLAFNFVGDGLRDAADPYT